MKKLCFLVEIHLPAIPSEDVEQRLFQAADDLSTLHGKSVVTQVGDSAVIVSADELMRLQEKANNYDRCKNA